MKSRGEARTATHSKPRQHRSANRSRREILAACCIPLESVFPHWLQRMPAPGIFTVHIAPQTEHPGTGLATALTGLIGEAIIDRAFFICGFYSVVNRIENASWTPGFARIFCFVFSATPSG